MAEITLEEGREMIERYKAQRELILKENYSVNILTLSETFTKDEISQLLSQNDCDKFRCYFGMDEDLNIRLILVAADSDNNDILEKILDKAIRDPFVSPPESALNS
jgi:hypothetical protein